MILNLAWLAWANATQMVKQADPAAGYIMASLLACFFIAGLLEVLFVPRHSPSLLRLPGWRVVFFRGSWLRFSTPGYLLLIPAAIGGWSWLTALTVLAVGLLAEYALHRFQHA